MAATTRAAQRRSALTERLFPGALPKLWCPPLAHYDADGGLDRSRIAAHLRGMAPYVKALLVPGTTSDAWEMDADERRRLLARVLEVTGQLNVRVLIGALASDADEQGRAIVDTLAWLRGRPGWAEDDAAMAAAGVCGFTVCPPTGRDLAQEEIRDALAAILDLGVPTALYQLPQVTLNEMTPETAAELAGRYANFYLLKDSSGEDRVATSGLDFGGVFLLRGAERQYDRWLKPSGGPYDGFLLSTANCFAGRLHRMIEQLENGRAEEARASIAPVEKVVARVFDLVAGLPDGNVFANANKAIDHFFAHGPAASLVPPPRLHAGRTLPLPVIEATGQALTDWGLMPSSGYLACP